MAEKKRIGLLKWLILVVLAVLACGGFWFLTHQKTSLPQYVTVVAGRDSLTQTVTATGSLNPVVDVLVGCQVSGIISKIYVDFNSTVTSNEVIALIDPSTYQAAVEQARADLENARANLELQQIDANRSAQLFTNNLLSRADYDTAVATLHEAESTVEIKQAVLDTAVANLSYCAIRSPVNGVVVSRSVEVGQTVASSFNTPTLFEIANDLTKMQIDSSVAEADIGGIEAGQRVDFSVDAFPYRTFHGVVSQVRNAPTNSNNVVTYDCVVSVSNADYKLKPGMTANLSFIIAQRDNVLDIPNSALRFHPLHSGSGAANGPQAGDAAAEGYHHAMPANGERSPLHTVYVLTGGGDAAVLKAVQVRTGITDGINTEVLSGLNAGDQVVIDETLPGERPTSNPFGGGMPRIH